MNTKYSDLEKQILNDLKNGPGLGVHNSYYLFSKFHEGINKDIVCSVDELDKALKILAIEGLISAKILNGKVDRVFDITGLGLSELRNL